MLFTKTFTLAAGISERKKDVKKFRGLPVEDGEKGD
jgi:hypothetical protein